MNTRNTSGNIIYLSNIIFLKTLHCPVCAKNLFSTKKRKENLHSLDFIDQK